MAVGIADGSQIPDGRTSISRAVEEPPFPTRQRAQPIHVLPTLAGHTKVGGRDERMVDLAPFGENDDEGSCFITHPRYLEPRCGHRTPVHHLHPCVLCVERDAVVEVAHRQGYMGQTAIDHHAPPLDLCFRCCSPWCTGMAKSSPGCLDPHVHSAHIRTSDDADNACAKIGRPVTAAWHTPLLYPSNSSNSILASWRSAVLNPSVNQP